MCLGLLIDKSNSPHKAQYCTICGKVSNIKYFETEKMTNASYRMLSDKEVFDKFSGIPHFLVDDDLFRVNYLRP